MKIIVKIDSILKKQMKRLKQIKVSGASIEKSFWALRWKLKRLTKDEISVVGVLIEMRLLFWFFTKFKIVFRMVNYEYDVAIIKGKFSL